MKAVVVYCHPVEGSFCSAMRDAAITGLTKAGHQVEVVDLAKDGFDPVMGRAEWEAYMTAEGRIPDGLEHHVDLVRTAEIVVFVYPTWWSGLPAQLKGWFERVLVPGVGFTFSESGRVRPAIEHVRRVHILTTYGSPRLYVWLVNDNGRRTIARAFRLALKRRAKVRHHGLYKMDTSTPASRDAFLADIESEMAKS